MRCYKQQIISSAKAVFATVLFCCILTTFFSYNSHAKCDIILKNTAYVSSDKVFIGDVASKCPKKVSNIPIAESPYINSYIVVTKRLVENILKSAGLKKLTVCGNAVMVKRKVFKITENRIKQLLNGMPIKIISKMPITVPFAHYRLEVNTKRLTNNFVWIRLSLFKGNHLYRNIGISAKLIESKVMPVAAHFIPRGAIIHRNDITFIKTKTPIPPYYLSSTSAIVGRVAVVDIKKNSPFSRSNIRLMPEVHRGDIVTVVVEDGAIHITTVAKALKSGFKQDIIPIMYPKSKRVVTAVVIGRKEVAVR